MSYLATLPASHELLRDSLYRGELFHLGPTAASLRLASEVEALMRSEQLGEDPRFALSHIAEEDFFARIGRIRKQLYTDPHFQQRVFEVVEAVGFDPQQVAFDPLRLRVVNHLGHLNPRAAPLYYPHRDTWFSLSQSVIAFWIALHDIPAEETFVIYPSWFDRPIDNDSERFDYDAWKQDRRNLKIGWQDRNAGQEVHYSGTRQSFEPGQAVSLSASRGDNVLFSGHHLHQTLGHAAGHTRYSLDFRMVHRGDHALGRGPSNLDNRSRGSATADYVALKSPSQVSRVD